MVRVTFKNLQHSDFVTDIVTNKINHVLEKFPEAAGASATVIVSMENSKSHTGADMFQAKLILTMKGSQPIILHKTNGNLYHAAAVLSDRLFETLHRQFERRRDRHRAEKRMNRWNLSGLIPEPQLADFQAVS